MFAYAKITKAKLFFRLSKDSDSAVNHSEKKFKDKQTNRHNDPLELYFHAALRNASVTLVISRNIFAWKQSSN